jgi:hypothetical protein
MFRQRKSAGGFALAQQTPGRDFGGPCGSSGPNKVLSVPDAIGIALYEWHLDKKGVQKELLRQTGEDPAF